MRVTLSNSARSRLSATHDDAGTSKRRLPSVCVYLNGGMELHMVLMLAAESRRESLHG